MWSAAASSVGGRGRALCVLVEKVDSARGDGGPLEIIVLCAESTVAESTVAVEAIEAIDATGFRATADGRLRLRIADAADTGSLGTREVGTGGGGDGGGECWYVVVLLYVVHEKRLSGPLLLPPVDPGVTSVACCGPLPTGVVGSGCTDSDFTWYSAFVVSDENCLFVGVTGL